MDHDPAAEPRHSKLSGAFHRRGDSPSVGTSDLHIGLVSGLAQGDGHLIDPMPVG
jgi:hypothetical protein